jgi:hypothetical protein
MSTTTAFPTPAGAHLPGFAAVAGSFLAAAAAASSFAAASVAAAVSAVSGAAAATGVRS